MNSFYYDLLNKELLSIADYQNYFGYHAIEMEEYLFFRLCEEKKSSTECSSEFESKVNKPTSSESSVLSQLKRRRKDWLAPSELKDIQYALERSKFYDEDNASSIGIDLEFRNGNKIYFYLNRYVDEPIYIHDIYNSVGQSIFDNLFGEHWKSTLKRLAVINDPDGYTNLREGPGVDRKVVTTVKNDELFYYTPNNSSSWWRVQILDSCTKGYIHNSRITPYGYMTNNRKEYLKEEVKKLHEGRTPCYEK